MNRTETVFEPRLTRLLDVLLPVLALAVTAAALSSAQLTESAEDATPVGWLGWLLAPALAAVLLLRRRLPVVVLVVSIVLVLAYYVSGRPPIGLELPLVAAFFSAALEGRWKVAAGAAVLLAVVAYGFRLASGQSVAILGIQLTGHLLVLGGAIGAGDAIRSRARERRARQERQRLEALQREDEVRHAAESVRREIALDVHDVVGHAMVVIITQAGLAEEIVAEDPAAARTALQSIGDTARSALEETRQSLRALAPPGGEERSPAPSIAGIGLLVETLRDTGLRLGVRVTGDARRVPATVDTVGYRIVREALTNVVRHAQATSATVEVDWSSDELVLTVTDDGRGQNAGDDRGRDGNGSGVRGMAHRAELIGGHLEAGPRDDARGFRVRAVLPVPPMRGVA